MARRLCGAPKFRFFVLGVGLTFIFAIVGFFMVQSTSFSACKCPDHQAQNEVISRKDHYKGNIGHVIESAHTLCVLVPFRDRFEELLEFAPHLTKFLYHQGIDHRIIIINQADRYRFNRASLINVGFLETKRKCDYIAMHDVDLLPVNNELRYDFPEDGPFHLAAPHLHPLYHYESFVGGILLIQNKHFEMLNGLSNKYWGWGKEDDEFFVRMRRAKLTVQRPGNLSTGYKTFRHIHDRRKRPRDNKKFFDQWEKTRRLDKDTGISTVKYTLDSQRELVIDGAPVTVMNVYLECDFSLSPWCLREGDHVLYKKQQEEAKAKKNRG